MASTIALGLKSESGSFALCLMRATGTHQLKLRTEAFWFRGRFLERWCCQEAGLQKKPKTNCLWARLGSAIRSAHSSKSGKKKQASLKVYVQGTVNISITAQKCNIITHLFSPSYYWFWLKTLNLKIIFNINIIWNISIGKSANNGSILDIEATLGVLNFQIF